MSVKRVTHGIYGGLVGGVVFGVLMGMMGMLPMVAGLAGSSSAIVGLAVHLVISAVIGAGYAVALGRIATTRRAAVATGLGYGALWWLLGPLTLMPLLTGMGPGASWNAAAAAAALPSLIGHLIYGGVLGGAFAWLERSPAEADGRIPQRA